MLEADQEPSGIFGPLLRDFRDSKPYRAIAWNACGILRNAPSWRPLKLLVPATALQPDASERLDGNIPWCC